ncbi:MAG: hypothetical protein ACREA3_06300 [Nitrosotalea sp.]
MKTLYLIISAIMITGILYILIPNVFADHFPYVNGPTFYSKNGTALFTLKVHEPVNIQFTAVTDNKTFHGYVWYRILHENNQTSGTENFTGTESPKNFTFSYVPEKTGGFMIENGISSSLPYYNSVRSQPIMVIENFSKAVEFNGQCKQPSYILIPTPHYSTGVCVKPHTFFILKERGWFG